MNWYFNQKREFLSHENVRPGVGKLFPQTFETKENIWLSRFLRQHDACSSKCTGRKKWEISKNWIFPDFHGCVCILYFNAKCSEILYIILNIKYGSFLKFWAHFQLRTTKTRFRGSSQTNFLCPITSSNCATKTFEMWAEVRFSVYQNSVFV